MSALRNATEAAVAAAPRRWRKLHIYILTTVLYISLYSTEGMADIILSRDLLTLVFFDLTPVGVMRYPHINNKEFNMLKKFYKAGLGIALIITSFGSVSAQGNEKPGVDLSVDVASTYLWRGIDIHAMNEDHTGNQRDIFNFAPALMPSLTVYAPIKGLWFNIWGSRGLVSRPRNEAMLMCDDEIDYTVGYDFDTVIGGWSLAFVMFTYPTNGVSYTELAASYTIPVILNPTLGVAAADANGGSTQYFTFGVSHDIEFGNMSLGPALTFGWWYDPKITNGNWGHLDLNIPFSIAATDHLSFHITPTMSYRMFSSANKNYIDIKTGNTHPEPAAIALVSVGTTYSF